MAKRETAADKLRKRLEEEAKTSEVIEEELADTPLSEEVEVGKKEEVSPLDDGEYTELGDTDVDLSDEISEMDPFDPENTNVDSSVPLDMPGEDPVVEEVDVFDKYSRLIVEIALAGAIKNPRVTAWSPIPSMMLNYFKATRPASDKTTSSEINDILSDGLIERYPDLYEAFQIVINESDDLHITNFKGITRTRPDEGDSATAEDLSPIE